MKESTAVEHVNRLGQVYYLQEGKTPTGKPKYYTGRKLSGKPLAEIPEGYEIYEMRLKHCQYIKMLRFELVNPDTRQYSAERWCFRGSIDDWFPLFGSGTLAKLVEKYAMHLDRESFFELMSA